MPLNGGSSFLISLLLAVGVVVSSANLTSIDLTSTSPPSTSSSPSPPPPSSSSPKSSKGFFLSSVLTTTSTTTALKPFNTSTATATEHLTSTEFFNSSTSSSTSSPLSPPSTTTFEPLPQPLPQQQQHQSSSLFKWNSVSSGQQNDLSYKLNCTPDYMTIEVNLTGVSRDRPVYVYLEKLKAFSICRPKMAKGIATFHLALDDNFYRCGTTKVHDQRTGTRVYYNRVIVEDKMGAEKSPRSVYFKCSLPSASRILQTAAAAAKNRPKRQLLLRESGSPPPQPNSHHNRALGAGQLVNFTEIDLPDNFMEAEILDLDGNITARAPYPHLNLKVKRNGQLVNTSLNVAPGTPLEMIIYLDEESAAVYGLLASFLKVTDSTQAQLRAPVTSSPPKEEVIVLNGCSIDPYIFGNFETTDGGDSVAAKFRAFKFPESNYVMFVGTVNVCLGECSGVPCGGETVAFGRRRRRRRRRSVPDEMPRDPKKVFEIEMTTYLQIGYSPAEEEAAAAARKRREQGESVSSSQTLMAASFQQAQASKLTTASQQHQESLPTSSSRQLASSGEVPLQSFLLMMTMMMMAIISGGGLLHR